MPEQLSLSAKLSKTLVALTIEFDNEFEQQFPHRTAWGPAAGSGAGPWLVSMAMWSNLMRWLDPDETPLAEVDDLVPLVNFPGLQRWGYLRVTEAGLVRPTPAGRRAIATWTPLPALGEARWRERFGSAAIDELRTALTTIVDQLEPGLPWYLPVSHVYRARPLASLRTRPSGAAPNELATMLSRTLITFRSDYEAAARLSLPVSANVLRSIGRAPVRVRDLPVLSGVSREAVSISIGFLDRLELATVERGPTKSVRLTDRGRRGLAKYERVLAHIEDDWRQRFGAEGIDRLHAALDTILDAPAFGEGIEPGPFDWRANPPYSARTKALLADPVAGLPQYPMVSHRGGYPDGS